MRQARWHFAFGQLGLLCVECRSWFAVMDKSRRVLALVFSNNDVDAVVRALEALPCA